MLCPAILTIGEDHREKMIAYVFFFLLPKDSRTVAFIAGPLGNNFC